MLYVSLFLKKKNNKKQSFECVKLRPLTLLDPPLKIFQWWNVLLKNHWAVIVCFGNVTAHWYNKCIYVAEKL